MLAERFWKFAPNWIQYDLVLESLKRQQIRITKNAEEAMALCEFAGHKKMTLARGNLPDLGFPEPLSLRDAWPRLAERFLLLPPRAGPLWAVEWFNQPKDDETVIYTAPVVIGPQDQRIFCLGRNKAGARCLDTLNLMSERREGSFRKFVLAWKEEEPKVAE